ncbi:hypothetical protein J6590_044310 [Homalodisca vitripennis]|nr:hypothetical protein J6590_044310 [Homalodisca vitripennis]
MNILKTESSCHSTIITDYILETFTTADDAASMHSTCLRCQTDYIKCKHVPSEYTKHRTDKKL